MESEILQVYSVTHFTNRGFGINLLRRFVSEGIMQPFVYVGNTPKFRECDFENAINRMRQKQIETREKSVERHKQIKIQNLKNNLKINSKKVKS